MTGENYAATFAALRPQGGFGLIMADPAWLFALRSSKGEKKSPQAHYRCMPLDEIKRLPVSILAAPDCLLWLWATNPMLRQGLDTLDAWGFTYVTAGTWVKRTKHAKDAFGPGYALRSSNEPFLIGRIGSPKLTKATRSTLATYDGSDPDPTLFPYPMITIEDERRKHSQKPDAAFTACEKLVPDVKRIELFSRTNRKGWVSWGDEAGSIPMTEGQEK